MIVPRHRCKVADIIHHPDMSVAPRRYCICHADKSLWGHGCGSVGLPRAALVDMPAIHTPVALFVLPQCRVVSLW